MTMTVLWTVFAGLLLFVAAVAYAIRARNIHYWLRSYIAQRGLRRRPIEPGTTLYLCVADHYEPYGGGVSRERAHARVQRWLDLYPKIAARHHDSIGRHPCHTFFYPLEEYDPELLDHLAGLTRAGFGDVDVHYHHDGDTAGKLAAALQGFVRTLRERHGLLRAAGADGHVPYCFVHGNWALDNSRPDGRWCGVDNELDVLVNTGCRVDFTLPSAPSDTQTAKINSIYFARGRPGKCKSHDSGRDVAVGAWGTPDELLIVQGPLGFNWGARKFGLIPRIENAEISADAPPSEQRAALWPKLAPRVGGRPEHIFLKLHTHGTEDDTMEALLGGGLERMWSALEAQFRDRPGFTLRYVSAWEMYGIIRDLAQGAGTSDRPA
jgi:hypothetical protein